MSRNLNSFKKLVGSEFVQKKAFVKLVSSVSTGLVCDTNLKRLIHISSGVLLDSKTLEEFVVLCKSCR